MPKVFLTRYIRYNQKMNNVTSAIHFQYATINLKITDTRDYLTLPNRHNLTCLKIAEMIQQISFWNLNPHQNATISRAMIAIMK
jgi:hypothetical protein